MQRFPTLYKYRALAPDKERDRTADILRRDEIYFASPSKFDDPFECRFSLDFDGSREDKVKRMATDIMDAKDARSEGEARSKAEDRFRSMDTKAREKWENDQKSDFSERLRQCTAMFCSSEINNDILMWSHYADGHKGICIEFDVAGLARRVNRIELPPSNIRQLEVFLTPYRVCYQQDYPRVSFYKTTLDQKQ